MRQKIMAVLMILMVLTASLAVAEDGFWTCSNCGKENSASARFCGGCASEKPHAPIPAVEYNAWICSNCHALISVENSFCIFCGNAYQASDEGALLLTRETASDNTGYFASYTCLEYQYYFEGESRATLTFQPEGDGYARIWIKDANVNMKVQVTLYDPYGKLLCNEYLTSNGPYVYGHNLKAGQTYTLELQNWYPNREGSFTLVVGAPVTPRVIDTFDSFVDRFSYSGQDLEYYYTPSITGRYRFDLSDVSVDFKTDITIFDSYDREIATSYSKISLNGGIDADLQAGEQYRIVLCGTPDYDFRINIGIPFPVVDITGCGAVGDTMRFTSQKNIYTVLIPESGSYAIYATALNANDYVDLKVTDEYGRQINDTYDYYHDYEGGKVYTIEAKQRSGLGDYVLRIEKASPGYGAMP